MAETVFDKTLTDQDIIDNHTSTSTVKPLSANQGKVIYDYAKTRTVKKIAVDYGNITFNASGYYNATSLVPTDIDVLFAGIRTWTDWASGSTKGPLNITTDGKYVMGPPNSTINGLKVLFIYYQS